MVPRFKEPFQHNVQAFGHVFGEHYLFRTFSMKQLRNKTAGLVDHLLRGVGLSVIPAVDIHALAGHEFTDRLRNAGRFREAGASIVKIDLVVHI